jgi:hypothetical protein
LVIGAKKQLHLSTKRLVGLVWHRFKIQLIFQTALTAKMANTVKKVAARLWQMAYIVVKTTFCA